jgi:hypothetical protein
MPGSYPVHNDPLATVGGAQLVFAKAQIRGVTHPMATLLEVYKSLFSETVQLSDPFEHAPLLPADIFAYTAHLLERSGAYHHVAPQVDDFPNERIPKNLSQRCRCLQF